MKTIQKDSDIILVNNYEDIPEIPSSLRFFYSNLCSIRNKRKFDEIKCILKTLPNTTHLLIFTETWIVSEEDARLYQIPGYSHIYNYRRNKKGGGVSIYVHNSIQYNLTENIVETTTYGYILTNCL